VVDRSKVGFPRSCARCSRPLSRYNDGDYCGGCAKAGLQEMGARPVSAGVAEIGTRLRATRLRRGMTLEVLAGLAGLSPAYISMVENGKRSLDRYSLIVALADALGVPPGELAPGMAVKRNRLAARRKTVGFSQEQLADYLRIDRSTVGRWESGETEPQPWVRPRLAKVLHVSVDQLDDLLSEGRPEPGSEIRSDLSQASVGTRIAELRRERELTQESLAERAGVSSVTISKLEQQARRPSLTMLNALAAALDVPVQDLLGPSALVTEPELISLSGQPGKKNDTPSDYLPAEVIERPDFNDACHRLDLGAIFRIAIQYGGPGFSGSHISRRCEMTPSQVTDYTHRGRQAKDVAIFRRVSDGLHIPGAMLRLGRRAWEADEQLTPLPEYQFPLSLHAMPNNRPLILDDPQIVDLVSAALPFYANASRLMGGRGLVEFAVQHIQLMCSAVADAYGQRRNEILAVCARYAEFAGWLYQDLGEPVLSLFWTDRALEWAQEAAAERGFVSYVLMRKSDHAEQYGSADRVLTLAHEALSITPLSPRAKALAVQQEARGYSQNRDNAMFERKLDEARRLIQDAEGDDDAPWGEYCDLTHLAMQEASGRIELGQFDRAIDIIERALPSMTPVDRLDSTVFRARLARAYAEAGYPDQAVDIGLGLCAETAWIQSFRAFTELSRIHDLLQLRDNNGEGRRFVGSFTQLKADFSRRVRQTA
jgi:transcriptional regulator with XRE-family HTH domain/tetratricopeptide (TPR) repeat protein